MSYRVRAPENNGTAFVVENTQSPTIFELSVPGRTGFSMPEEPGDTEKSVSEAIPPRFRRDAPPPLPEVNEVTVTRHLTYLSGRTISVDGAFYPLGSCTMKYNPKVNEDAAALPGFCHVHPAQAPSTMQGFLRVCHELARMLSALTGLEGCSLQPAAGAHGEYTSLLVVKAYLADRGETRRDEVIIPDTAHGTNPASAHRCNFKPIEIRSGDRGRIDVNELRSRLGPRTACVMITNPNTLGLFEDGIDKIARMVHEAGALIYLDGANFNAILGRVRPVDFGADLMHINLHKTFAVPHGGGGPGAGPICVRDFLAPYLPAPHIEIDGCEYRLNHDCPKSIGKVRAFFGNVNNAVRSYAYIRQLGEEGLRQVSDHAVLNANYLLALLAGAYDIPYGQRCMHEFVINATKQKTLGVKAMDIGKKLLDYGFHAPTTYFPLIVPEALMIEPTETESKEMLELFAGAMLEIARLAAHDPAEVTGAPRTTPVGRMDELSAARQPVITWPSDAPRKGGTTPSTS